MQFILPILFTILVFASLNHGEREVMTYGRKKMLYSERTTGYSRNQQTDCIYNLLKKNEFRWVQLSGGEYRISKKSFDDWLDKMQKL